MTVATSTSTTYPILRKGSTGDDVKHLQNLLNYVYGPDLKVDGIFGAKTEAAVKKFQKDYGLTVDGIVGPKTWSMLQFQIHD
jgi:peptidoglycan hydrolase-like protein with peptidoglycan-binding domain